MSQHSATSTLLQPSPGSRRPSSRRALTRALELAQEAVRIDASNDDPHAAVLAYAKSVNLLNEVMERVMRGEDSTDSKRKGARRRSIVAKEDEARRLKSIHDTYYHRMQLLTLIYNIPPPTINAETSPTSTLVVTSPGYSSSSQPPSPPEKPYHQEQGLLSATHSRHPSRDHLDVGDDSYDAVEGIGSAMLAALSPTDRSMDSSDFSVSPQLSTPTTLQPLRSSPAMPTRGPSSLPPMRQPPAGPPPTRPRADSLTRRISRQGSTSNQPPPAVPPLPANVFHDYHVPHTSSHSYPTPQTDLFHPHSDHIIDPMRQWEDNLMDEDERLGVLDHEELNREIFPTEQRPQQVPQPLDDSTFRSRSTHQHPPLSSHSTHHPADSEHYSHPFAYPTSHVVEEPVRSVASRPPTPASNAHRPRPRGNTQSSTTSSRSEGDSSAYSDRPRTPPPAVPLLVSTTTAQGTISQRRKVGAVFAPSGDSSLGVNDSGPAPPLSRSHSPAGTAEASSSTAPSNQETRGVPPPSTGVHIGGRHRAASQPGRRPSIGGLHGTSTGDHEPPPSVPPLPQSAIPRKTSFTGNGLHKIEMPPSAMPPSTMPPPPLPTSTTPPASAVHSKAMSTYQRSPSSQSLHSMVPSSPYPAPPPADPLRRPYYLMNLLHASMTNTSGGYLTKRLHVPHTVWTQGGAKLTNIVDKGKCIAFLESGLDELVKASTEFVKNSNPAAASVTICRVAGERWLRALDEWVGVCDAIVANLGKKLGLGDGTNLTKKTAGWNKVTRTFDRMTNGKK
ncbi:hypothetical protein FRC03_004445 [Tulasnella sp. 419]|nr:hypothetical protein FRC03_004445 [Tulasnella sp. 419]